MDANLSVLETEVAELIDILMTAQLESGSTADDDVGATAPTPDCLRRYAEQVARIAASAAQANYESLQTLCERLSARLQSGTVADPKRGVELGSALEQWPMLVMAWLENPTDPDVEIETELVTLSAHIGDILTGTESAGAAGAAVVSEPPPPLAVAPGEPNNEQSQGAEAEDSVIESGSDEDGPDAACSAAVGETSGSATVESAAGGIAEPDPVAAAADELSDAPADEPADEPAVVNQEFLELLGIEVAEIVDGAAAMLLPAFAADSDGDTVRQALESYAENLERLVEVATGIGLEGLTQVCQWLHINHAMLAEQTLSGNDAVQTLLRAWPSLIMDYLHSINDGATAATLIDYLSRPEWPQPLDAEDAAPLHALLVSPQVSEEALPGEERQRHAMPDDVSLSLLEGVNPELLDSLLAELPNQTAQFSEIIQRFVDAIGNDQDVDQAQRIAHTLKGAANTVGVPGIANLTHHVEDILVALAKHDVLPNPPLADSLMNVADCLETMSESLLGMSAPPDNALEVLQSVLDWANLIDREGVPAGSAAPAPRVAVVSAAAETEAEAEPPAAAAAQPAVAVPPQADAPQAAARPQHGQQKPEQNDAHTPMLRVPAPLIDDLLRLVGESIILTGQVQERVNAVTSQIRSVRDQNGQLQRLVAELEQLVDVQSVSAKLIGGRVNGYAVDDFDPLEMEQYNELHTVTHRLVELANDSRVLDDHIDANFAALDNLIIDQSRLHRESQEAVMRTRMVPVKTMVPRLARSVRQTCRLTDKDVELRVSGEQTLMDSNVLGDMIDPLMHVLRNAIDHGIEDATLRVDRGKPATGHIDLSFTREGNSVVVRCQDDGGGLDFAAIRRTAEARGLIAPNQQLGERELTRMILQSGFSTRDETTQVSGRGIGMDAVYSQLRAIKGSLNIESKAGEGCLVELRLPLTLISTHAMLVRLGEHRFAIADRGIERIVHPSGAELHRVGDTLTYRIDDEIYPLAVLDKLLGLPGDTVAGGEIEAMMARAAHCPALLIRDETGMVQAVLVDSVIDSRDLVVKGMGSYVPKLPGILGATILGDGGVIAVLDVPELMRSGQNAGITRTADQPLAAAAGGETPRRRSALIVDDSLSVRRSMTQLVSDAGFAAQTARDGLEAISLLQENRPDVILVDLEMPRMNGLELTSHVRAQNDLRQLPVIMITSRATEKHREQAKAAGVDAYMTKPVSDDALLSRLHEVVRP